MAATAIVGGTGLVGSNIVNTLLSSPSISHIDFLARRAPSNKTTKELIDSSPAKLSTYISTAPPSSWAQHIRSATPAPEIFFSSLATTRAAAGSLTAQRALEHDANVELARAAKEAGAKIYVLISSTGADQSSKFPYMKLKGDIEKSILDLDFEKTIIIRPGFLAGKREEHRMAESIVGTIGNAAGWVSKPWLKDWWAQDALEVARAAVSAGLTALKGTEPDGQQKVRILTGKDIIRLGRTEWKDGS
ncbi:Protein fmp52, mitochondrial [Emydomyces testavorans]|uniref:Protein fmp52, mitochondrial n=1 Tax=Emydomyces testavorans TaxID=2070801 RepID=A0AAF0IIM1_9EURO|nr:Protein fmp52, mitochondrial [Emydomyces testavorans]